MEQKYNDIINDAMNDTMDDTTLHSKKRKVKSSGLLRNKGILLVLSENFFGNSYLLNKSENTIGRDENCDISVNDPLISKQHCVLESEDDSNFYIEDLGSTNSTFLNNKKLKKKTLVYYGDRILIGNTIFRFFLEEKVNNS